MAKRAIGESKEAVEELKALAKEPLPEITFAEAEVQQVADFVNYVYLNGSFSIKMSEMKKMQGMLSNMNALIVKMEKYIFEHRRVIAAKKAAE